MSGAKSRRKGAAGELELAAWLRSHGYSGAHRGRQYRGGPDSPDTAGGPPGFHLEAKRTERLRLYPALEQAAQDAAAGEVPVVWHRANRKPAVVVMLAEDWIKLVRKEERP